MADPFDVPVVTSKSFEGGLTQQDPDTQVDNILVDTVKPTIDNALSPESVADQARAIFEAAGMAAFEEANAAVEAVEDDAQGGEQESAQAEQPTEEPAEEPVEQPAEEQAEEPVEDLVEEEPAETPADAPIEEQVQEAAVEPEQDLEATEGEQLQEYKGNEEPMEDKAAEEEEQIEQLPEEDVGEQIATEDVAEDEDTAVNEDNDSQLDTAAVAAAAFGVAAAAGVASELGKRVDDSVAEEDSKNGTECSGTKGMATVTPVQHGSVADDCKMAFRELVAVFVWVCACQIGLVTANGPYLTTRFPDYPPFTLWLAIFLGLMTLWECTGLSLGSTLNPSVALAHHVAGVSCASGRALGVTMAAQLAAHALGVYATRRVLGSGASAALFAAPVPNAVRLGGKRLLLAAATVEAAATFVMCAAILALQRRLAGSKATKAALTIAVVFLLVGGLSDVTGAVMNPFQAGALALFEGDWRFHGAYAVGPLVGALGAGFIHNMMYKDMGNQVQLHAKIE